MIAEPQASALEVTCDLIVTANREITRLRRARLYDKAGNLASKRAIYLQSLLLTVGRDMLAKMKDGQRKTTRRVGSFTVEAGIAPVRICACHGTYVAECDTVGKIEVVDRGYEPYITVREAD
jgi:hypothetical protein